MIYHDIISDICSPSKLQENLKDSFSFKRFKSENGYKKVFVENLSWRKLRNDITSLTEHLFIRIAPDNPIFQTLHAYSQI